MRVKIGDTFFFFTVILSFQTFGNLRRPKLSSHRGVDATADDQQSLNFSLRASEGYYFLKAGIFKFIKRSGFLNSFNFRENRIIFQKKIFFQTFLPTQSWLGRQKVPKSNVAFQSGPIYWLGLIKTNANLEASTNCANILPTISTELFIL